MTQGDGLDAWGALSWTYDKIGNRLSETRDGNTDTYSYATNGSGNTPILESIDLAPPLATRDFTHGVAGHLEEVDSAGNVIDFTFDEAGWMSAIDRASASESVDTRYDGRSFLSLVERPVGADLATTEPTYSSEGLLHCLERQEGSTEPLEITYYFYLAGRPVAQLLTDGSISTWTYLTTDHLGTPLMATDPTGDTVWQGPLEPFGRDWTGSLGPGQSALENELYLRFPGQWEDGRWTDAASAAGMYNNLARWYWDGVGRYGKVDPLGIAGDAHPYLYASARPLVFVDPHGEKARVCCTPANPIQKVIPGRQDHCFIQVEDDDTGEESTYGLHRVSGKGCPYQNGTRTEAAKEVLHGLLKSATASVRDRHIDSSQSGLDL